MKMPVFHFIHRLFSSVPEHDRRSGERMISDIEDITDLLLDSEILKADEK